MDISASSALERHERVRVGATASTHQILVAPLLAVAAVGAFAIVVNLLRFGFARDWLDPAGYLVSVLKPLLLSLPMYLVLRVTFAKHDLHEELERIARAMRWASLTTACYAPVIWFYLLSSPTSSQTFPIFAFAFGAAAFWIPLVIDLARGARGRGGWILAYVWLALMGVAEAHAVLTWIANGIEGRSF